MYISRPPFPILTYTAAAAAASWLVGFRFIPNQPGNHPSLQNEWLLPEAAQQQQQQERARLPPPGRHLAAAGHLLRRRRKRSWHGGEDEERRRRLEAEAGDGGDERQPGLPLPAAAAQGDPAVWPVGGPQLRRPGGEPQPQGRGPDDSLS